MNNPNLTKFMGVFLLLQRARRLAEQHCPEMLDEDITCEKDIHDWVQRFLNKLPAEARKEMESLDD